MHKMLLALVFLQYKKNDVLMLIMIKFKIINLLRLCKFKTISLDFFDVGYVFLHKNYSKLEFSNRLKS